MRYTKKQKKGSRKNEKQKDEKRHRNGSKQKKGGEDVKSLCLIKYHAMKTY
jgi:hypothetical protein